MTSAPSQVSRSRAASRRPSQENSRELNEMETIDEGKEQASEGEREGEEEEEVEGEEEEQKDVIFDTQKVDLGEVEIDKDVKGSFVVQNNTDGEILLQIFEKLEIDNEETPEGSAVSFNYSITNYNSITNSI